MMIFFRKLLNKIGMYFIDKKAEKEIEKEMDVINAIRIIKNSARNDMEREIYSTIDTLNETLQYKYLLHAMFHKVHSKNALKASKTEMV